MAVVQNGILYALSSDVSEEIDGDIQDTQRVYLECVLFHDLPKIKFIIDFNKIKLEVYI